MAASIADCLDWTRDGQDWPHRGHSHFVDAGGIRWHLQRWEPPCASAPWVLLIHGTGAATHSWRGLAPLLARQAGVLAMDLPGHGFTSAAAPGQASIVAVAGALIALLQTQGVRPAMVVGHSAGAALAVQMALEGEQAMSDAARSTRPTLVAINGALLPLAGVAGAVATPLTRLLASRSVVPRLFAWSSTRPLVLQGLLASTGSAVDAEGRRLYGRLLASPAHAAGALAMMAQWDLQTLAASLPRLRAPLHLLAGSHDRTVPPQQAVRLAAMLPAATLHPLQGLGHLAHEEQPVRVGSLIASLLPDRSAA